VLGRPRPRGGYRAGIATLSGGAAGSWYR
jgi:hypothetical protein